MAAGIFGAVERAGRFQIDIHGGMRGGNRPAPVASAHAEKYEFMSRVILRQMQGRLHTGRVGSVQQNRLVIAAAGIQNLVGKQGRQGRVPVGRGEQDGKEFPLIQQFLDGLQRGIHAVEMSGQCTVKSLA